MFGKRVVLLIGLWTLLTDLVPAQDRLYPSVTVVNRSGDPVLVKFVGPTPASLSVAAENSETTEVVVGGYYLKLRYGARNGHYRYARTGDFFVQQTAYSASRITITLHSVAGNMNERAISAGEF
jgi:hypothetical protein